MPMRIEATPEKGIVRCRANGRFMHICGADDDRPCVTQLLDNGRILLSNHTAPRVHAGGKLQPLHRNVRFDRNGNALERTAAVSSKTGVTHERGGARALGIHLYKAAQPIIKGRNL